jgi:hypothetical protein
MAQRWHDPGASQAATVVLTELEVRSLRARRGVMTTIETPMRSASGCTIWIALA